jgi:hypothetical protein
VKPVLLFLLKFLVYSLLLFSFGHRLLHGYISIMGYASGLTDPLYRMPPNIENFLYGSSMTIIAFLSLIFATPEMPLLKKTGTILMGMAAFFLTDLLFVQYAIFPNGKPVVTEDSPLFEIYLCIKWLLPFLLWIIMSYPYVEKLFRRQKDRPV